ncbi:MAG: MBL fold metallo-hydrolase [Xanthobacteraceae bacterium]|jgi:hypothetical protein
MMNRSEMLKQSQDMEPVHGSIEVAMPATVLWEGFDQPWLWPRWNPCFFWCANRRLRLGDKLIWCFEPIRPWYCYKMPAIARIVELETGIKVTWEVTAIPGFYARHTYSIEALGQDRSRFTSWEKACGWGFRLTQGFWLKHFTFVKIRSLRGVRQLEIRYLAGDRIDAVTFPRRNYLGFLISIFSLIASVGIGIAFGSWAVLVAAVLFATRVAYGFYDLYVRLTWQRLGPGIHAVLGGGGNTLVIKDAKDVLVVDTKFPPAARALRRWLIKNSMFPVTKTVNTHYHFDHSYGNVHYPDAERSRTPPCRSSWRKLMGHGGASTGPACLIRLYLQSVKQLMWAA